MKAELQRALTCAAVDGEVDRRRGLSASEVTSPEHSVFATVNRVGSALPRDTGLDASQSVVAS